MPPPVMTWLHSNAYAEDLRPSSLSGDGILPEERTRSLSVFSADALIFVMTTGASNRAKMAGVQIDPKYPASRSFKSWSHPYFLAGHWSTNRE